MSQSTASGTRERVVIATDRAPAAIGTYSQAVRIDNTVYLSGQIPLVPSTMEMVGEDFAAQAEQVFTNLAAVCEVAILKLSETPFCPRQRAMRLPCLTSPHIA